jgi:uncharacterized heparinase superfamily protein
MADRRPLTDGLKTPSEVQAVDPALEREFVHGKKAASPTTSTAAAQSPFARVPISTRIRSEYAEALKRASLERQLNKVEPNTLQDILEQAIEPWLRSNGYIR